MAGSRSLKLSILGDVSNLTKNLDQADTEVKGFGSKLGEFGKKAAAAFAVAAAAAVAYAGKLAIDGVKAAIEDEAAQERLATSLRNVTGATDAQIAATEKWITKTALAKGIADDELRPALDRLTRSTKDIDEAQRLLNLAMDISAGTGKSLETVTNALGKALDGNTGALGKLGVGIDAAKLKTMTFDEVTAALAATFEGQAANAADTFQGKMARLQIGFDEAKESLGAALLPILEKVVNFLNTSVMPAFQTFIDVLTGGPESLDEGAGRATDRMGVLEKEGLGPNERAARDLAVAFRDLGTVLGKLFAAFDPDDKQGGKKKNGLVAFLEVLTKILTTVETLIEKLIYLDQLSKAAGSGAGGNWLRDKSWGEALLGPLWPGRAAGGPVTAGKPYLVGERGPELVVPRMSGTVIPNHALGAGGNTYITVQGAIDPESTARQIQRLLTQSTKRVGVAIA